MELTSEMTIIKNIDKPKALFICHEKYLNAATPEGGVKFCTDEYLSLINIKFETTKIPVHYTKKWSYRFKKKLRLSAYDEYQPGDFQLLLNEHLENEKILFVFLNLTHT